MMKDVKDAHRDLIEPAVQGTMNVLKECAKLRKTQSNNDPSRLQRIVLTSSIASLAESAQPNKVYDEKDWNEESTPDRNPYLYSKTIAEKSAWNFMKELEETHGKNYLELVTILPSVVIGPPLNPNLISQSHESLMLMAKGEFPVILPLDFAFVDVRDVALSHILAMEYQMEDSSKFSPSKMERFVISGGQTIAMKDLVNHMRKSFPNPPFVWSNNLPTLNLPFYLGLGIGKVAALIQPKGLRQYLNSILGKPQYFSNKKARNVLGIEFLDWEQSVRDSVSFLDSNGFILSKM